MQWKFQVGAVGMLGQANVASVAARLAINRCDLGRGLVVKVAKTWVDPVWDQ